MRRSYVLATTAAGAALAAGLIAVPALAAGSSTAGTTPTASASATCPCGAGTAGGGRGMPYGRGAGMAPGSGMNAGGGMGAGMGRWGTDSTTGDPLAGLARGSLGSDQKAALAGMAEEEKLAHDVYVTLAATTKDVRFSRISTAESRHLTEVRALLTRYGISDPTAGKSDGVFATAAIQQQYTDLVARGSGSPDAALAVGRDIEKADLAALDKAGSGITAQDVRTVYARLVNGSQMHLRAFGG
jgi:hypothetical protein